MLATRIHRSSTFGCVQKVIKISGQQWRERWQGTPYSMAYATVMLYAWLQAGTGDVIILFAVAIFYLLFLIFLQLFCSHLPCHVCNDDDGDDAQNTTRFYIHYLWFPIVNWQRNDTWNVYSNVFLRFPHSRWICLRSFAKNMFFAYGNVENKTSDIPVFCIQWLCTFVKWLRFVQWFMHS